MFLHFNLAAGWTDSPQLPKAATELGHQPRTHLRYPKKIRPEQCDVRCKADCLWWDFYCAQREGRSLCDICKCETVWRPDCPHLRIIPSEPASCQKMNSSRQTQGVCKIKVTTMTLRRNMHVHITGNPEGGRWAAKLLNDTSHFFNSWPDSREKKDLLQFFFKFSYVTKNSVKLQRIC